jgi:predicted ArsR family transcriptional regulator
MTDGLADIVAQLERKKAAIEKALAALREVDEVEAVVQAVPRRGRPPKRKGALTEAGRKKLSDAMKKRWALKRPGSAVKKAARKKRGPKKAA